MPRWTAWVAIALLTFATPSIAQERVTEAKASFIFNGERIQIARDNPRAAQDAVRFINADTRCGGPCVFPMVVAPGVVTLGELEVLDFLVTQVAGYQGLMVDARAPHDRVTGYIPGTVSLPYSTLEASNNFRSEILLALGARELDGAFNFADARHLLVYDNGPSSDDAGQLVRNLLQAGYPTEMIHYYRGGMQAWSVLGFSIREGRS